jgi:uncharacterized protein (TIGR02996 family)
MSLRDAFLADICEHPDDDAPRLVYADWLDDNGEPERAELIRVQCELARLTEEDIRWAALEMREAELLVQHGARWLAESPLPEEIRWDEVYHRCLPEPVPAFWRGFPDAVVALDERAFARRAGAIFAAAPVLRLRFETAVSDLGALLACPSLELLHALSLDNIVAQRVLGVDGMERLAKCPYLARLQRLELTGNQLREAGVEVLARAESLPALEELDLSLNGLTDGAVAALAGSPLARRLRELCLWSNQITDAGADLLLQMPELKELFLVKNPIPPVWLANLAASPGLRRLRQLSLGNCHFGDRAISQLAAAKGPFRLTTLVLPSCAIGGAGVDALVGSDLAEGLIELGLDNNRIGPDGVRALAGRSRFGRLRFLRLTSCGLDDDAARILIEGTGLDSLTVLDLRANPLLEARRQDVKARFGRRVWLSEGK